jgi:3-hydroxybutyryl-CoA dehydratase
MITDLKIGDFATFSKTISESDVYSFAGITGDFNPVHIDIEAAKKSIFGKRVIHGMLSASLISTVLGTRLPGPGSIYLSQNVKFLAPAYIGDTLTAKVIVEEIDLENAKVKLQTLVINQNDKPIITGNAEILYK